ncbi:hypothetical protein GCM10023189_39640 [Nibrella saemangeumensis]|uniref:HIG1 domain-containing protein n=1 Tax=Nibrella saemangeumensis TaxID=1084526 RepID=A0ABP8N7G8_9BACT
MQIISLLLCVGSLIGAGIPLSFGLLSLDGSAQSKRRFRIWFQVAVLTLLISLVYIWNLVNR